MREALMLADQAAALDEVPVGAVVVLAGEIIGRGFNQPISSCDPTAHAEIVALRDAAKKIDNYRLVNADLYVTLEPCAMCAGAIVHARVNRLIYAAAEPKSGVVVSKNQFFSSDFLNHHVSVVVSSLQSSASEKLSNFFKKKRKK